MKICFITTIHQSMGWFVADAAKCFAARGHHVYYICNMDEDFIKEHENYAHCINIPMERGMSPVNMLSSICSLYKVFKKEKFDVIQYATPNASLYASIASKMAGVHFRVYGFWGLRYEGFEGFKRKLFIGLEKLTCALSTHVRIVSKKNMEIAIKDGVCPPNKIDVIGLGGTIGVDTKIFDLSKKQTYRSEVRKILNISDDSFLFTFIGRINADKGINELIEAFKEIESQFSNVRLLLLGMEDKVNPIKEENLEWALKSVNVIMPGPVHRTLVAKYIAASDILVHPSYREGFGKIIQEAMSMEIPVITTDIPGPSEVVEKDVSGILVPKADALALKEAMVDLYKNKEKAHKIAKAGYVRFSENFTMVKMVENIYKEYSKITGLC